MYKNEEFIQAQILVAVLLLLGLFISAYPYFCMLSAGMLMIVFTLESLWDETDRLLFAVQVILSAFFALAVGGVPAFLIFYECRAGKKRWLPIFYPAAGYCVYGAAQREAFPRMLCNILILLAISGVLNLAEWLTESYLTAQKQISRAVSVTAVNELYEKKLNRELTIKNYLADKNARLEERENISRNIHNSVGHSITAAIMTLDAADMLFDASPDKAREKMNMANERIRTSLSAIRHAVRVLDSESEFISMTDFLKELNAVIDRFVMDTTIEVHVDFTEVDGNVSIPHEHTEFLTGAVQELLTNGVRHGGAGLFVLRLAGDSGHIKLMVSDNGRSDFSEENCYERIQNGFGLKKMISYAKKCGGRVLFVNKNGFYSEITLPLIEEDEHE